MLFVAAEAALGRRLLPQCDKIYISTRNSCRGWRLAYAIAVLFVLMVAIVATCVSN